MHGLHAYLTPYPDADPLTLLRCVHTMRCLTEPAPKFAFYDPKKLATKPSFPFRPTSFVLDPTKVRS